MIHGILDNCRRHYEERIAEQDQKQKYQQSVVKISSVAEWSYH